MYSGSARRRELLSLEDNVSEDNLVKQINFPQYKKVAKAGFELTSSSTLLARFPPPPLVRKRRLFGYSSWLSTATRPLAADSLARRWRRRRATWAAGWQARGTRKWAVDDADVLLGLDLAGKGQRQVAGPGVARPGMCIRQRAAGGVRQPGRRHCQTLFVPYWRGWCAARDRQPAAGTVGPEVVAHWARVAREEGVTSLKDSAMCMPIDAQSPAHCGKSPFTDKGGWRNSITTAH
ncbi:hypothetical protein GGX14DRAFT_386040 [Mycena pura]|uniref:Uncharacterized protein n=1 Tax=Mycena pura TaxID=153505 RepID=A0AAD6YS10_9AGAR|nr:hypothetical protein GGX14DRAFT_386040 [Mycena pura]